ncbi:hypothetical protein [Intestinibacter sp.]|uniref:hypothetical protein n=1 Tax=Intestinibacter sp. TaxID=1965304 RepID=UPI002A75A3FE|nr:hypothetical protein [Intestinibacter sp.]MDY2737864.1 hypothetical protein [Intestinibacter sp.]
MIQTLVPEDGKCLEKNGTVINVTKDGNTLKITIVSKEEDEEEEKFDDTEIKEAIQEYKDKLNDLDDCLFVSATEDFGKEFEVKRFDELLNKETLTADEAMEVTKMIDRSLDIISDHLRKKIEELVSIYNRF